MQGQLIVLSAGLQPGLPQQSQNPIKMAVGVLREGAPDAKL